MKSHRLLAAYQAAVDFKFDHTREGSPAWKLLDEECDRLCYDYVVARREEQDPIKVPA